MATILEFSIRNGKNISDKSFEQKMPYDQNDHDAEIIIFPGIRIERISPKRNKEKRNRDKLSKIECQL